MACSQELGGENYAKLCQTQAVVVEVLKALLVKETSTNGYTIDQLLLTHKRKILSYDIGKRFSSVLFPQGNQATDLDDWDLKLFCFILRTVCTLPLTQDNDMNDVRLTRNAIHHLPTPIISDSDYLNFSNVLKTFIANALNYLNDQHLKAEIKQQVDEAERPVSKQVIKAFELSHKLYLKDKSIGEDLKEQTNENTSKILEDLKEIKAVLSTLPKELMSQLNTPVNITWRDCLQRSDVSAAITLIHQDVTPDSYSTFEQATQLLSSAKEAQRDLCKVVCDNIQQYRKAENMYVVFDSTSQKPLFVAIPLSDNKDILGYPLLSKDKYAIGDEDRSVREEEIKKQKTYSYQRV